MTDLAPERRAELRDYATEWLDVSAVNVFPDVLTALLDAADERDRLRAAVRQIADACHWSHDPSGDPEALVAHIGQLQQIAEDACDERDPDPHTHLPITEDADGLTCDICGAELADWAAADEHVEQHEGWVG